MTQMDEDNSHLNEIEYIPCFEHQFEQGLDDLELQHPMSLMIHCLEYMTVETTQKKWHLKFLE